MFVYGTLLETIEADRGIDGGGSFKNLFR